ncbi:MULTISPECIES: hypothetical protein [Microvirga]|uniref:hypothetical protein n=1 Tax=Microvirga TaxID=186650 RepID=UPI001B395D3F|nr:MULTISPECIES: hypothetical protein [unclassified Microvirga]MBQ0819549.1 hypothetical protein [Microvirga sp. HBU67558]
MAGTQKLNLTRQEEVQQSFSPIKPLAVVVAAAKGGSILANDAVPAGFTCPNLTMKANMIGG